MTMRNVHIVPLLLLLTAVTAMGGWALAGHYWALATICLLGWGYLLKAALDCYRKPISKLHFLLNAFRSSDFNFKYPEEGVSANDKEVNHTLNEINQLTAQVQHETREKEKYYALILNKIYTGILVIDENGNVQQTNDEALRLLGLTVLTHISQIARVDEKLARYMWQTVPGDKHQVSIQDEKGTRHLSLHTTGTLLAGRKVRLITLSDINNELDEKEIDSWIQLIRVLTHEIMNAITPIHSLSDTLLKKAEQSDSELQSGLQVIHTTSRELMDFVESYRTFTHLPTPQPSLFYVDGFCRRMQQLVTGQFPDTDIQIEVETTPSNLIVLADEGLITRVMLNLLKNAIQAIGTNQKGLITIRSYSGEDEAVIIDVTNNGPLIPADVAAHIFVPFFTTKRSGHGIGLSLSRRMMVLQGGMLELCDQPRHGCPTAFLLTIPLSIS